MTTFTVLQEQSMLLYVIAGLLIVLIVVGIGVWLRLGEVRDSLAGKASSRHEPKVATWRDRPVQERPSGFSDVRVSDDAERKMRAGSQQAAPQQAAPQQSPGPKTSAYDGGKPPQDIEGGSR